MSASLKMEIGIVMTVLPLPNGLSPEIVQMALVQVNSYIDFQTVEVIFGRGKDTRLIPGDTVFVMPVCGNSGNKMAIASSAILLPDVLMLPGDSDIHANVAGVKVSQVKCGANSLITIKNATQNLSLLIAELITILSAFQTVGSPGSHITSPATIAQLTALQAKFALLLSAV